MARATRYSLIIFATMIWSVAAYWHWTNQSVASAQLHFFDIGQGDAMYLRTLSGKDILIDGGPDRLLVNQLGQAMPFWDRTIEIMVLTHPHLDHVAGLVEVFNYYQVNQLVLEPVQYNNAAYEALLAVANQQHTAIQIVHTGDTITLGPLEQFTVLYPFAETNLTALKDVNDTSIVLRYDLASVQPRSVLLMGDATQLVEDQLLQAGLMTDVDILKVGHHGSRYSSTADFIQASQPEYAIIQSGAGNSYGHPHAETLARLAPVATVLRNDQLGTITFSIQPDGTYRQYY